MEKDVIDHPNHYQFADGSDVLDILKKTLTPQQFEGFLIGNILKYVYRFDKKDGSKDLKKAMRYLDILTERRQLDEAAEYMNALMEVRKMAEELSEEGSE